MLSFLGPKSRLCDGYGRREFLRAGSIGLLGSALMPASLRSALGATSPNSNWVAANAKAKRCIVLFLTGGPPQHSTWDPKPDAPADIRGAYKPIQTKVPGIQIGELMPETAELMDKIAILRAVTTGDHAHSSSGYAMLTGQPHQPLNFENANPGAPNNWPSLGAVVQHLNLNRQTEKSLLPDSIRLPQHIFNTDKSVWPGQDSGFLGSKADPWMFRCEPASDNFKPPEFQLHQDVSLGRFQQRRSLLQQLNSKLSEVDRTHAFDSFNEQERQALNLLSTPNSINACDLDQEPKKVRDRYGNHQFGQSTLLARRLIESGVSFVQVNWFRGPDDPADAPLWDSHSDETKRLKKFLIPPFDQGFSALMHDLIDRDMLDETLVVCMAEFGRTPKFNARGGRDHWGHVFSIAMAGGGIQGGVVHGSTDNHAAYPVGGTVKPNDILATIFDRLGFESSTEIQDRLGRPFPISSGNVIKEIIA